MVADRRSRLGRQIRKMLEGYTAGPAALLTNHWPKVFRQQPDAQPYTVHLRSVANDRPGVEY